MTLPAVLLILPEVGDTVKLDTPEIFHATFDETVNSLYIPTVLPACPEVHDNVKADVLLLISRLGAAAD